MSQPQRCPHHGPSAVPGDVLLARSGTLPLSSPTWLQPRFSRCSGVCSWGAPRPWWVQRMRDELRSRRQLQGKEQIPLSQLMLCICVSVGAGALPRSVALFLSAGGRSCHSCAAGARVGSSFVHPEATNVMWALKLRCQDSCQGLLVPTPRLGRNLRPGKPWSRSVWMGTFGLGWAPLQSPALVGEDKSGFAVGVS